MNDAQVKFAAIACVCVAVGILAFALWRLVMPSLRPAPDDNRPQVTALEAAIRRIGRLENQTNDLQGRLERLEQTQRSERSARSLAETRAETPPSRNVHDDAPLNLIERTSPPPPRAWARDEAPYPEPERRTAFTAPRREPASDQEAIATLNADPAVRAVLERFNRLAAAGDRPGLHIFAADQGCAALAEIAGSEDLTLYEDGPLWWAEVDSERYGLLLPSQQTVQQWDKFYRSLSGQRAKDKLGGAFDVQEGDVLRVAEPAWARRLDGQTFRRVERGRLLGI